MEHDELRDRAGQDDVEPAEPGAPVRVSVTVEAPPGPATCTVHWKMVDGEGRAFFPMSRPLFFEVTVAG